MHSIGFTIFEYLIWVAVAIGLVVVLFICLALGVAVSSAVNPLAAKWKLLSSAKKPQSPEPDRVLPIQINSRRKPEASIEKKTEEEPLAEELEPQEVSPVSTRRAS